MQKGDAYVHQNKIVHAFLYILQCRIHPMFSFDLDTPHIYPMFSVNLDTPSCSFKSLLTFEQLSYLAASIEEMSARLIFSL